MATTVSVVIPNLHCSVVGQTLEALHRQDYDLSQAEVLVVGLDRYGLVKEDELVRVISTEEPVGPARARNIGFGHARGDTIIFLDADCVPRFDWLAQMLAAANTLPNVGAISGGMTFDDHNYWTICDQVAAFHEHMIPKQPGPRRSLASYSLLVPHHVLDQVGGFDESFPRAAGEDLDLTIRITRAGYMLYFAPQAVVTHRPSRSSLKDLWRHAIVAGHYSIRVRHRYAEWYGTPKWASFSWAWRILSPGIALVRTIQIMSSNPSLWSYWYAIPGIILFKLAWCWGAAQTLSRCARSKAECQ